MQGAAEAAIRTGAALCGQVTMTHQHHMGPDAHVEKLEWSPCSSWVPVQLVKGDTARLYVLAAMDPSHSDDQQQEATILAGIPCTRFAWLGNATGILMVSHRGIGGEVFISIYSAASGGRTHGSRVDHVLFSYLSGLSPCRTLLLVHSSDPEASVLSIWNIVTDAIIPVQLLQFPTIQVCRCLSDTPWSHDSKFCVLRVCWIDTEDTSVFVWRLMLCKADGI